MLRLNRKTIYLVLSLALATACGGSESYNPDTSQDSRPLPQASKSLASAQKRTKGESQHSKKTSSKQANKESAQELREIRAREINVLKNDIEEKRQEIKLKQQIRVSLMNQKNQIDGSEIDAHSTAQNPTAGMVGAVSSSGGGSSSSSWVGPIMGGVGVAAAAMSDRANEQKQQAAVNAARQRVMRKIAAVDTEINQLEQDLKTLEDELEKLIDPDGLIEDDPSKDSTSKKKSESDKKSGPDKKSEPAKKK